MDAIKQQCEQLQGAWASVSTALRANPAAFQPYSPNLTLEQLDEVVGTVVYWLGRVRAPKGFAPVFHVAKALAATALAGASNAVQALQRAEYGHFPSFVVALNQVLSSLHAMLVFSDRSESRDAVAELGGKLSQSLALLDTAQKELEEKKSLLESIAPLKDRADSQAAALASVTEQATGHLAAITQKKADAEAAATALADVHQRSTADAAAVTELLEKARALEDKLGETLVSFENIAKHAQSQTELIDALLPKGASAGLASAFASRVGQLERTKWIWMGVFLISILGLCAFATLIIRVPPESTEALWKQVVHRLPLAAPLIWLGWFSAIQYGNTLRVQEDYAFKEATSKAFAGYRDHLDHLANVSLPDGNNAMNLLAAKTIEILSHEPLRIFQSTDKDASPSHSIIEVLKQKSGLSASGEASGGAGPKSAA